MPVHRRSGGSVVFRRVRLGLEQLEDRLVPALSTPQITTLGYLPPDYTNKGIAFTTPVADFTSWSLYVNGSLVLSNQPPDGAGGSAAFTLPPLSNLNLFSSFVVETTNGSDTGRSALKIGPNTTSLPTIVMPTLDWATPPSGIGATRIAFDAQVSSLLLGANQQFRIGLQDWAPDLVASPQFVVKTNRPGVVDVSIQGTELVIDTSRLQGQAGITSIQISDTNAPASRPRYIGIQVKDVAGNLPADPGRVVIGAVNDSTDPAFFQTNVLNSPDAAYQQYDYQYVYLNDGPKQAPQWQGAQPSPTDPLVDNTRYAWRTSSGAPDGKKLLQLLQSSSQLGGIPTVVYYNIMCGYTSTGALAGESEQIGLANLRNAAFMRAYFDDLKFTLDTIRRYANGSTVSFIMEPDFLAYLMKSVYNPAQGTWADPATITLGYDVGALAAEVGLLPQGSSTGANSSLVDWVKVINSGVRHLSRATVSGQAQSVNLRLGWKFNLWAADFAMPDRSGWSKGISKVTDWFLANPTVPFQGKTGFEAGVLFVKDIAAKTASWYKLAGILDALTTAQTNGVALEGGGMNFIAIDKYGIDGGNNQAELTSPGFTDPASSRWFFNADHWNNYVAYAAQIRSVLAGGVPANALPIWMWQIPVGHINDSKSLNPKTGATYVPLANSYYNVGQVTFGQWEDSAIDYIFGDTFTGRTAGLTDLQNDRRQDFFAANHANDSSITFAANAAGVSTITWGSHLQQLWDAGVQAILFGPGLPQATMGGGYASQPPKDDYYFAARSQQYFASGSGTGTPGTTYHGNVQAGVSAGRLRLSGDADANGIRITAGPRANTFYIAGIDATTVNGRTGALLFAARGFDVALGQGNDFVDFDGASRSYAVNGPTSVNLGDGNDLIGIDKVRFNGSAAFVLGSGRDALSARDAVFSQGLFASAGAGPNTVTLQRCRFDGAAMFDLGAGDDSLQARRVRSRWPIFVRRSPGTDRVNLGGVPWFSGFTPGS